MRPGGRPAAIGLFRSVAMVVTLMRKNITQEVAGAVFGVSQATWISRSVRAGVLLWREPPCRGGVSHHDAAVCAVAPPRVCCWCDCSSGSCRWDADVTKGGAFDGRLLADPSVAR